MVYYNSRLLAKTNSCFLSYHILFNLLQLTSPQGDEQYGLSPITVWCHFNSRLRKETNISHRLIHCVSYISIHVSARRRTLHSHCYLRLLRFQFTSPQGDERILIVWSIVPENFNSHLRKETNYPIRQTFQKLTHFNSRLRKETNENYYSNKANISYFNSRLREETNLRWLEC